MSEHDFLERLDTLFTNSEKPDLNKLEVLISETFKFFESLREKLQSPNEVERDAAMELAKQVQHKLESLAEKAYSSSGMNPKELEEFLANEKNFSPEEWKMFQKAQEEIKGYQEGLASTPGPLLHHENSAQPTPPFKPLPSQVERDKWKKA